MSVYDKLADLKEKREQIKYMVGIHEKAYRAWKKDVLEAEKKLRLVKKHRNTSYKMWKDARAMLALTDRRIKAHPQAVRAYTKRNPFRALENDTQ